MKTILPKEVTTIEQAKEFLGSLYKNEETYHPEDNAHDIIWQTCNPTEQERNQLNKLMDDIYKLPGNDKGPQNMSFDPCKYLLDLDKIQQHKVSILSYLRAFEQIWDSEMESGDEETIDKLTKSYVIFTDAMNLPRLSADELIIHLEK